MKMNNNLHDALSKCEIQYGNCTVSKEHILQDYWAFLTKITEEQNRVSFSFRTSSICFDIIAIFSMAMSMLSFNDISNDDVVSSLECDDIVLYKGQRYRWKGITIDNGNEMIVLEQDGRGKNGPTTTIIPFNRNKHNIKPYYGESSITDGRGIRKKKTNREELLSLLLNIPVSEVPSVLDISFAVVSKRQRIYDICKNLKIKVSSIVTPLVELFPVAYYTGNGTPIAIGHNPCKANPVVRFTEQISIARDMILERNSTTIGLLVIDNALLASNGSELDDLISRSKPLFIHVSTGLRTDCERRFLAQYSDYPVFPCTKNKLLSIDCLPKVDNYYTAELSRQMISIQKPHYTLPVFQNQWTDSDYCELQNKLTIIRRSLLSSEIKDDFVISALSLINLFSSAVFPFPWMEMLISKGLINISVHSADQRLNEMLEKVQSAQQYQDVFTDVISFLQCQYNFFKRQNPKYEWIKGYLTEHTEEKILIIVPKAYYISILSSIFNLDSDNIICTTNRRFNSEVSYDTIISLCWAPNHSFDPLQCYSAKQIYILLYSYEKRMFSYLQRTIDRIEKQLNGETITGNAYIDEIKPDETEKAEENMVRSFIDFEKFIDDINTFRILHFNSNSLSAGSSPLTEIHYIGRFTTGDHIFFSKQYVAVVYLPEDNSIIERPVKELMPGDILVFTHRDDFTRNIVDIIFDRLLENGKLDSEIAESKEKAQHWKNVLRAYKLANNLKHREIAKKLSDLGAPIDAGSVRQWLAEEGHIIGPRQESSMAAIAQLTQDLQLLENTGIYFEACRSVRSTRRKILKMISSAINDKLSGFTPPAGSDLEIVYQNVDKLAETLELEYVSEVDKPYLLQIGFTNRPLSEEEVP